MVIPGTTLEEIIKLATDNAAVVEIYPSDAVPPFDPAESVLRFAATDAITFRGFEYDRKIVGFGTAKRNAGKEKNSFSVTLDNLSRETVTFELTEGFEGKILVLRLLSRSLSENLSDSLVLFAGRCKAPESGNKREIEISAEQIFGSLSAEIPRRKFTPEDAKGRAKTDPLFEGFVFLPQYGTTVYYRKKSYLFGLIKKKKAQTLQWSSFSDIDADKSLPFGFGRVQVLGTHLGYADKGTWIATTTAFLEGKIKAYLRYYSTDPRFTLDGAGHLALGDLGGEGNNIPITPADWIANGYYSRTAWAGGAWHGTTADETDPAPDLAATLLAKTVPLPDASGVWTGEDWSDNAAALVRYLLTNEDYEKLNASWLNDASFTKAFRFNDEFLFDTSFSDLVFIPEGSLSENIESAGLLKPTGAVSAEYLKYQRGEREAADVFGASARTQEVAMENVPFDPTDVPEPGEFPAPSQINVSVFLKRRYTCNAVASERQKLWDWINETILPASRMFLTQGFDGKINLKHKKAADFALSTDGFSVGDNMLHLDDVSAWVGNLSGYVLIEPHSNASEVRKVIAAQYSPTQNSVSLTASSNISVTAFSGGNGANIPATASLTVNSADDVNSVTLDGEEISVFSSGTDTPETIAGFFYGSINAHPRLRRKFRAEWTDNEVVITAKFGTLVLDDSLEFDHPATVENPAANPSLAAVSGGDLPAGVYYVSYAFENASGRTLPAPAEFITLSANQKISVSPVSVPAGVSSVIWYASPEANSKKLRKIFANDGSAFEITNLPLVSGELPNDLNRTGTEVLRVVQIFSDRALRRAHAARSNVLKSTYKFILGRRSDAINTVVISFRDATQDFRLVELRVRDESHIAKVHKENKREIDGSAIDNFHQAYRIAAGELAEQRDADFFYNWQSDRESLFLEEADVVCVTDAGAGLVNFPVIVEDIEYANLEKGYPTAEFTARKYSSTLYDDSVVEREIPVIQSLDDFAIEPEADGVVSSDLEFINGEIGVILIDRTTGARQRIIVTGGVLSVEEVE